MSTKILLGIYLVMAVVNGKAMWKLIQQYKHHPERDYAIVRYAMLAGLGVIVIWTIIEIAK